MFKRRQTTLVGAFLVLTASAAHANLLVNGSFETGSATHPTPGAAGTQIDNGTPPGFVVQGWSPFGGLNRNIAWLQNGSYGLPGQDGGNFIDLTGYSDAPAYDGIEQLVTGLTANASYRLTFYVGTGPTNSAYRAPVSVGVSSGSDFFAPETTFANAVDNSWALATYTFVAASSTVDIAIRGLSSGGGQYIGLDNVDLERLADPAAPGTVPEPTTLGLMGLGIAGLAAARRRKAR